LRAGRIDLRVLVHAPNDRPKQNPTTGRLRRCPAGDLIQVRHKPMMAARPGPLRGHGPPAGACVGHLTKTAPDRLHHSIVVSLLTGARAQELRALRWDNVHLDGNPDARPPIPPHIEVWRSVRRGGDTKTRKSRRTLALPARCIEAPRKQRAQQAADRLAAGDWQAAGWYSPPSSPMTRGKPGVAGRHAAVLLFGNALWGPENEWADESERWSSWSAAGTRAPLLTGEGRPDKGAIGHPHKGGS
jgi:hypothetical protein